MSKNCLRACTYSFVLVLSFIPFLVILPFLLCLCFYSLGLASEVPRLTYLVFWLILILFLAIFSSDSLSWQERHCSTQDRHWSWSQSPLKDYMLQSKSWQGCFVASPCPLQWPSLRPSQWSKSEQQDPLSPQPLLCSPLRGWPKNGLLKKFISLSLL